jgi:hypothetical protein
MRIPEAVASNREASECSVPSGASFVRKCLALYFAILAFFWIVALTTAYWKPFSQGKPLSVEPMVYENGVHRFSDFADFDPVAEQFELAGVKGEVYPAPMVCVYLFFTRTFDKPLHKYLLFLVSAFTLLAAALAFSLHRSGANRKFLAAAPILTLLGCYPFLFLIERANAEWVVFLLNAAALTAFVRRRHLTAGLLIAVATSMKIFPCLLFVLLLARKRYRELAISIAVILPLQVLSLWILGPSVSEATAKVRVGMENISRNFFFGYNPNSIGDDHSLFSIVKRLADRQLSGEALNAWLLASGPWYSVAVAAGLAALYWFRIRKLPLLNQAMVLVLLSVTLPYLSFEYTLIHVLTVWALFVLFLASDVTEGRQTLSFCRAAACLGLTAFLISPAAYVAWNTQVYGGQVKTLALLALSGLILATPLPSRMFDGADLR